MAKIIKQTLTEVDEKKHCYRINAEDFDKDNDALQSIYIMKAALKKAGVKGSIRSIDVQITVHEGK